MHRFLCFVVALTLSACQAPQPADRPAAIHCAWGPRDSIRVGQNFAFVEPPLAAPVGEDVVVMGGTALERLPSGQVLLRSSTNYLVAGFRIDSSGRAKPIELPQGVREFTNPRLASLPTGRAAVFWQGGSSFQDTATNRLWFATLTPEGWSSPEVVDDSIVDLGMTFASRLVSRGEDLALANPSALDVAEVYVRRGGTWHLSRVKVPIPRYSALTPVQDGWLMATVYNDGINFQRLGFDGQAQRVVQVAAVSQTDYHYPALVAAGRSDVMVAWVEGALEGKSTLHGAHSDDGGSTWTRSAPLVVEGGLSGLDAIFRNGVLYVTSRQSTDEGPWPFAAALRGRAWERLDIHREQGEIGAVAPRFSHHPTQVELFWALSIETRMRHEPPTLVRIRLRTDCSR